MCLAALAAFAGCRSDLLPAAGDGSLPDASTAVDLFAPPVDESVVDAGACAAEVQALAAEMYAAPQTCTATVRLAHESRAILGYQLFCGHYASTSEATARATAQADSGFGGADPTLNPMNPTDEYVFYRSPGDFGGVAAVSVRNGLSVFGGSIVWNGAGDISHPKTWRAPAGLGAGCPASGGIPGRRGYDLVDGTALPGALVDAAVDVVLSTALPGAMWQGGYVFDAVVLRYPRSVGLFDPNTAEWIVIVNAGWLE
jgi:hypothetical protein